MTDLRRFLGGVSENGLLETDKQNALIERAQRGDVEARNEVLLHNQLLIATIAKDYARHGDMDDLLMEGEFGLIRAIEHYDTTRGVKFATYAAYWIRQAFRLHLQNDTLIRVPAYIHNVRSKIRKREPVSARRRELAEQRRHVGALESDVGVEEDDRADLREEVRFGLGKIHAHLRNVLVLYYGLDGREKTLDEIASVLRLSRQRVHQLLHEGLRDLRAALGGR